MKARYDGVCLVGLWLLMLGGCAATQPVTFYTLSPLETLSQPTGTTPLSEDVAIGVGPVTLPEFIERPQIVVRTTLNRIEVDEFHRWGGSLQEDISRTLAQNLSALIGTHRVHVYPSREPLEIVYRVALDIRQFDGQLGESIRLNAIWILIDEQTTEVLLVRRFTFRAPAATLDYESLVAAHSAALAALSREIAGEVIKFGQVK
ncbi:MAG: hypothetical protein ETSY1_01605 [Candidatus Entotheonella factor]|uniref:ABC-type transport auxiliary lipoprotein component domain-containing protein n=1 Tax=Entotheonella factor TaxID=1429438 RepID=W4LYJ2_ENTF1|nr:PqiC family protein [Candidatus Entotheonella palauensis]ETX03005.1 MAG: hypothetical protein ETSY1_01605 [Candidatus Entotheonella factor]